MSEIRPDGREPDKPLARVTSVHTEAAELGELYARAWPRLIGLLVSMGGARADAEEVAQDAFEKLIKDWEKVRRYENPEAWLRTVAVRLLISRHRRSRVALKALTQLRKPDAVPSHSGHSDDRVDLRRALSSLSVEQRAVLLLHVVCDQPVETIARDLRIPVGTVKSRLARARTALAPLLEAKEASDHA